MSSAESRRPPFRITTRAIHGGQRPDPVTGAVMPPISTSSTYAQESPGVHRGYEYSRSHNPTRYAFERAIADLEGSGIPESTGEGDGGGTDTTCGGFAFASGLAATGTCLELLDAGDTVLAMDDLYGGTYRLLKRVRERTMGLNVVRIDMANPHRVADAVREHKPKMIWTETPTNPMLKVVDLDAIAKLGAESGAITVCDSTFCSPMIQRPLEHGIDIVMHSATKYLGGHSDVVGGVLVTRKPELAERLRFLQNAIGSVMGPFDAYLCLRGVKTLALRMQRHSESAMVIARWLEGHPKVQRTIYPGLASHPQHAVATRQMTFEGAPAYGGMITAVLKGGLDASRDFLERVRVFTLAESLGGVESLIEHPAIMTHASIPPDARAELGIDDGLVRLSVGIEHVGDLLADLDAALEG